MSISAYQLQHLDWAFIIIASIVLVWWAACLSLGWHAVQLVFRALERATAAEPLSPPPPAHPVWRNPQIPPQARRAS